MYRNITHFVTYLRTNNTAQHTINAYKHDVYQWASFCARYNVHDVRYIQQEHIDTYMSELERMRVTRATAMRKCAAIRHFMRFCAIPVTVDPYNNTIDIFCSDQTIASVYKRLLTHASPFDQRDACFMLLQHALFASYHNVAGMRIDEVQMLDTNAAIQGHRISAEATRSLVSYMRNKRSDICRYAHHDTNLLFPYVRHTSAVIMPHRMYMYKLRWYLAYEHCADTRYHRFSRHQKRTADSLIKRRYLQFHDRA